MACNQCQCLHIKCVKNFGEQKCMLHLPVMFFAFLISPSKATQEGRMHHVKSSLDSDALSDCVEFEEDKLKCHVQSLLNSDAISSFDISESNVDVFSEFDDNSSLKLISNGQNNKNISMVT